MPGMAKVFDSGMDSSEDLSVFQDITWALIFRNSTQCVPFHAYQRAHSNGLVFLTVQVLTTLYVITKFSGATLDSSIVAILNVVISVLSPFFVGWVLVLATSLKNSQILNLRPICLQVIENLWVVGACIAVSLDIFTVVDSGQCASYTYIRAFHCSYSGLHQMPEDRMIIALMVPTVALLIMKQAKWECVCLGYAINVFAVLFCIVYYDLTHSLGVFLYCLPFSTYALYEVRRQQIITFLLSAELERRREQNAALPDGQSITAMRHMVGNLAHDLKTPLSAFNGGVHMLTATVREMIAEAANHRRSSNREREASKDESPPGVTASTPEHSPPPPQHQERLCDVLDGLEDMSGINTFMLMTIHRCIDYTKAADGVKLKPSLETISLSDTLRLPLSCMRGMSEKITFTLAAIPSPIVDTIITDKQWLQENVLCLLSNAAKYSGHGQVVVSVALFDQVGGATVNLTPTVAAKQASGEESPAGGEVINSALSGTTEMDGSLSAAHASTSSLPQFSSKSVSNELTVTDRLQPRRPPQINVHSRQPSARAVLRVEVEDTGIGMSDEVMRNLFQPFKQAQRMAGGTGLGLFSLAKRMDALGASYGVQRRRDGQQGSIFWFDIPYRPDTSKSSTPSPKSVQSSRGSSTSRRIHGSSRSNGSEDNKSASRDKNSSLSIGSHLAPLPPIGGGLAPTTATTGKYKPPKLKILLVDDSLSILKICVMMLRKQGHTVTTAENGILALDTIAAQKQSRPEAPFDVVLMDMHMPVMDGLEATRRLRCVEEQESHHQQVALDGVNDGCEEQPGGGGIAELAAASSASSGVPPSRYPAGQPLSRINSYAILEVEALTASGRITDKKSFIRLRGTQRADDPPGSGTKNAEEEDSAPPPRFIRPCRSSPNLTSLTGGAMSTASTASQQSSSIRKPIIPKGVLNKSYCLLVIGVSANSDYDTVQEAFEAGVDAFIPKPFSIGNFNDTYKKLVELETEQQQQQQQRDGSDNNVNSA